MKRIRYLMRVLRQCRMKQFWQTVSQVQEITGYSRLRAALDMMNCALLYGAGYHDYLTFGFYRMGRRNRKTYLTRVQNKKLISLVNDTKYLSVFEDKAKFCKCFAPFLNRSYLLLEDASEEEIEVFLQKNPVIFAKSKEGGRYMERLVVKEFESLHLLMHYVMNPIKRFTVLEAEVKQHEMVSRLYPCAVNSLRVVTLIDDAGVPQCLYSVLKMGNGGRWTDSRQEDSLVCPVDLLTGKLAGNAYTPEMESYGEHPYTKTVFKGYSLPYVPEAVELAKAAAMVIPQMRYMGWNVALTPDGPELMEGVTYPEYAYSQLPEYTPNQIGLLVDVRKHVKEM